MTIHTALLDRAGYVTFLWHNTRPEQLDARKHQGTLMAVAGHVVAGMRYVDGAFLAAPLRPHPEAVRQEGERRIELHFPDGFRRQITAIGQQNAIRMHRYIGDVHRTVEQMIASEAPPESYKDDRHWPTPPLMVDLPVAQRIVETVQAAQPAAPITVHVHGAVAQPQPVINSSAVERQTLPAVIEATAKPVSTGQGGQIETFPAPHSQTAKRPPQAKSESLSDGESDGRTFGIDPGDPLYALKVATVRAIADVIDTHKAGIPHEQIETWQDELAQIAAHATAETTIAGVQGQGARALQLIDGAPLRSDEDRAA